MQILAIETSCDETAVALYDTKSGLINHMVHSQEALHAEYGGVVPELASRDHICKTLPLINVIIKQSNIQLNELDGVAFTSGPGLMGALLVGAGIGRSLAWALNIPAIGVHHLEGHLVAPMLDSPAPIYPFIALVISGGHTLLVDVIKFGHYTILGESLDDAVGEAFDKTAKLLGLAYPGGGKLAELAKTGNPKRFCFPRPMLKHAGMDFSFSGLKTFAVNTLHNETDSVQTRADIARAFEDAVIDTLSNKSLRALKKTGHRTLVVSGGVSANNALRLHLHKFAEKNKFEVFFPRLEFCTDNAAMIAFAGSQRLLAGQTEGSFFAAKPRWRIDTLPRL